MSKEFAKKQVVNQENPLYYDTWKLLKSYLDTAWNLELAVQQVKNIFEIEYLTRANLSGTKL